ncbi:hypothetical protein BT69DRAFT_1296808 [Atractiella rhizophila]|nr:hypothetical protein BT69DRAFT_1296808 [Atractiella rhizophila]
MDEGNFRPTERSIILAMKHVLDTPEHSVNVLLGGRYKMLSGTTVWYFIIPGMELKFSARVVAQGTVTSRMANLIKILAGSSTAVTLVLPRPAGKIKKPYGRVLDQTGGGAMEALKSYLAGDGEMAEKADTAHEATIKNNTSPAERLRGRSDERGYQVQGEATGFMRFAFAQLVLSHDVNGATVTHSCSLTKYPQQSYLQLLKTIREELKEKYSQKPQLLACHPIDTDLLFTM